MKSYIQGLITGAVFVFAFMVLIGASNNQDTVGRYAISTTMFWSAKIGGGTIFETIIDTATGEVVSRASKHSKGYSNK